MLPPVSIFKLMFEPKDKKDRICPRCGSKLHVDLYNHVLFCPNCYYEEVLE